VGPEALLTNLTCAVFVTEGHAGPAEKLVACHAPAEVCPRQPLESRRRPAQSQILPGATAPARYTTQRNPMWVVAVSCDWGDRAAGRYR